ncbi:2-oxoglutarate dehydrogenase E1 component [Pleionea sp. CnH1-48]|uniref:2-oxoglutarate dehydrogenase E1 component n=1 Tax=Pleionea sp. CnH1-48 TaxID=2954494 RepID=UPI00209712C9|nr:2-oxoglutarate dehydrogenase E1 component [Pleionea sp. CnH1-48]MCO7223447.1 2-oxoglutarate dehydrogenase E1 component [Pleionea sp. CnH1-48]
MEKTLQEQFEASFLTGGSADYLEEIYEQYLEDPSSIDESWRSKFDALKSLGTTSDVAHSQIRDYFLQLGLSKHRIAATSSGDTSFDAKQVNVLELIQAYRAHGHQYAKLDPLGLWKQATIDHLDINKYGLSKMDMDTKFRTGSMYGADAKTLKQIIDELDSTYCRSIGAEFMHMTDPAQKQWVQERLESSLSTPKFDAGAKRQILSALTAAEGLEKYLHNKFPGAKRFSLEGGDSLLPMLEELIQRSGSAGVKEVVIGMAHRGRLNVLVNLLGKNPDELFAEFAGTKQLESGSGDVKYHQGFSSDINTPGGTIHLALAFNPSHLEIVGPVIQGSVRSRLERRADDSYSKVLPIVIHGDSAFTGQGVVMEAFNMSQARGYKIGGSVHIVINNQVGFTTNKPEDTRSTTYCTDVAKMVEAPIFHVNGDDPEAVVLVTQLALDFRETFKKDVVIDLVCYRRHGHNEADEPRATQPLMYAKVRKHPTPRKIYADQLEQEGTLEASATKELVEEYRNKLDEGKNVVSNWLPMQQHEFTVDWTPFLGTDWLEPAVTSLSREQFDALAQRITEVPEDVDMQMQVKRIMADRVKMANGEIPMDWGFAETMAYASLLDDQYRVRISGQDSGRGTFFHRHAVLHNQKDGTNYQPLKHISGKQAPFDVIDSVLSEEAVLAFEYGYSTTEPRALVVWEAQFGDFANGAQVVIDQFISSGEHKWGRLCGLVMLLPHGYEGQGPEHSSARLERYLQLCAEHNMQVCVPSTPAQVFHMLRRQMVRNWRTPLVVMSPKSLLRHRLATSSIEELTNGKFEPIIDEIDSLDKSKVKRVVMCSGKVFYDLLEKRRAEERDDVAIIRIEQLYPFPRNLKEVLEGYENASEFVWCQEEPKNQGAWYCSRHNFQASVPAGVEVEFAGRPASAAPAAGHMSLHVEQQKALLEDALGSKKS